MRAKEFINEAATPPGHGDIPKSAEDSSQSMILSRDKGGYDRTYHMNRLWMAMACADGKDKRAIKGMDPNSFTEKYNTIHPYTQAEHNMVHQAMATIPTESHDLIGDHRSLEAEETQKISPVSSFRGYNHRKKKK